MIISAYLFILAASTSARLSVGSRGSISPPHLSMLPSLTDTYSFRVCQVSQGACLPLVADGRIHVGRAESVYTPTGSCFHIEGHFYTGRLGNLCISQGWLFLHWLEYVLLYFNTCTFLYFIFGTMLLKGGIAPGLGWAHAGILGNSTLGGIINSTLTMPGTFGL